MSYFWAGVTAAIETMGGGVAAVVNAVVQLFGVTSDAPDGAAGLTTSALAGAAAALALAIALKLYFRRRERTTRDILRDGATISFVIGLVCFVAYDMRHAALDYLGLNGSKPAVEFEIRLPASAFAALGRDAQIELHTDRNQTIGRLQSTAMVDDGHPVLRGSVPIDFRTADRMVILNLPGEGQHLFKLRLAANPSRTAVFGPWHLADRVTSPNKPEAPRDATAIRYRVM